MQFQAHSLANGLEIVAEVNPHAYSASYAFFVKTGARDEGDAVSGVSHFLEHMVFKGTASRSAADVNRELDELSSSSNAFTSEEQTVYYATTLPEDQSKIVQLLADMMRPALRPDDFDTEKQVNLEEIAKYDDQPPYGAHEKCMAAHFGKHPLGRSILGSTRSVGELRREQMLEYFESRYSPRNIVLAAAGNINFPQLVAEAERNCGGWRPFDAFRPSERARPIPGFAVLHKPLATQEYVIQIAAGPSAEDDDRYAARVLATILGDDTGSRFFWELMDTGLAESASLGVSEYQGSGVFMTGLACEPDQAAENLRIIREILEDAQANGVTDEELTQAKNKIGAQLVLSAERPASRMFSIGNSWVQRRQYKTIREGVDLYRNVTREGIAAVLKKYPLTQNTTVAVGPLKDLKAE